MYLCLFINSNYARLTKELYAVKSNLEVNMGPLKGGKEPPKKTPVVAKKINCQDVHDQEGDSK